jgi:integrase
MVKGLEIEAKRYTVSCNGLQMRVGTSGDKTWVFAYRGVDGKPGKRLTIGNYPSIGLYEANAIVLESRTALARGVDPAIQAKLARTISKESAKLTVGKLAEKFLAEHIAGELTIRDYRNCLESYILPKWKDVPVEDIRRVDIKAMLKSLTDRGITRRANMTRVALSQMWKYGIREELVEYYPLEEIKDPAPKTLGKRFLTEDEIPIFWEGLNKIKSWRSRNALKLILLLCRRENELVGAQWNEFNLDKGEWFIPVQRELLGRKINSGLKVHKSMMHMIDGLLVPLSPMAVDILKELKSKYGKWEHVFPGEMDQLIHHSGHALSQALRRRWKDMGLGSAIKPHDLRRTAITHMSRMNIQSHVVQRVAGHSVGNRVQQTYNRYEYLKEKREALEDWADEIQKLISPSKITSGAH